MKFFCTGLVGMLGAGAVLAAPQVTAPAMGEGVELTVYHDDLALVREQRRVHLPKGAAELLLSGVSDRLLPDSVRLDVGSNLKVHSVTHRRANLDPQALLEAHVGKWVTLVRTDAEGESTQQALLLSAAGSAPIVRMEGRVVILDQASPWRVVFAQLPAHLDARSSLSADVAGPGGAVSIGLSYLTQGLDWEASYAVELAPKGEQATLTAWLGIHNRSDAAFESAQIQLVAGSPNRVGEGGPMPLAMRAEKADVAESDAGDYRVYTLPEPVTLAPQTRKQFHWFSEQGLPAVRSYHTESFALNQLRGQEAVPVDVRLRVSGLQRPLPQGLVRVYANGAAERGRFLGEARISSLQAGAPIELRLGSAEDVRASRELTEYSRQEDTVTVAWRVRIENDKAEPVTVAVTERFSGNWKILSSNFPHRAEQGLAASWSLQLPAHGVRVLEYRAEAQLR